MSWELVLRHCAAIRASLVQQRVGLELVDSQVAGLEAYARAMAEQEQAPTARIETPEHCKGHGVCGLQDEDAREPRASLAHPRAWVCRGCRALSSNGVTLDP